MRPSSRHEANDEDRLGTAVCPRTTGLPVIMAGSMAMRSRHVGLKNLYDLVWHLWVGQFGRQCRSGLRLLLFRSSDGRTRAHVPCGRPLLKSAQAEWMSFPSIKARFKTVDAERRALEVATASSLADPRPSVDHAIVREGLLADAARAARKIALNEALAASEVFLRRLGGSLPGSSRHPVRQPGAWRS